MFNKLNTLRMMRVFFEEPSREFNIREIARILKIAPATASKELRFLKKEGLLVSRDERMLKLYKADLDSNFYRDFKVFYNLRKLRESGLIDELNDFYTVPVIILFGSASFGLDDKESDFDLAVISENVDEFKNLEMFEKKINRRLQIFNFKSLKSIKNNHLINNILKGIVIQGDLKWI